jgi:hypothetical protein
MLVPGNIHQDLQAVFGGQVEEPAARNMVDADHIGAQLADLGEIGGGLLGRSKRLARRIERERTIRHAFDAEFFLAQAEKLTLHSNA